MEVIINSVESALKTFESAAILDAQAIEEGNSKVANESYDLISKSVAFLKANGELHQLKKLLLHINTGVRLWASYYCLPLCEQEALAVLRLIREQEGIHSLDAKTTISEWLKGNLHKNAKT